MEFVFAMLTTPPINGWHFQSPRKQAQTGHNLPIDYSIVPLKHWNLLEALNFMPYTKVGYSAIKELKKLGAIRVKVNISQLWARKEKEFV
jgi:hypothetical protein